MSNPPQAETSEDVRHILSLSGGKDSTALAVYMRDRVPEMEYVFCDTGKELSETYDYLERIEAYLGRPVVRLKHDILQRNDDAFENLLQMRGGFLPSPQMRWCTEYLKIKPFERYVGDGPVVSYIGIRADEDRKGYISHKANIVPRYPFIEDGLVKRDIVRLLEDSGLGLPEYYSWRSRSGCYFCFFQQRIEWVGLLEHHPDLFRQAMLYEKHDPASGTRYTWSQRESLRELSEPDRVRQIKAEHDSKVRANASTSAQRKLMDIWNEDDGERACLICDL